MKNLCDTQVPILRSSAVLRPEFFGGLLLNHFLPPEIKLDRIRFWIACMCNGGYTLQEIKEELDNELCHSKAYIDYLVEHTLNQFETHLLLSWKEEKLDTPSSFSIQMNFP